MAAVEAARWGIRVTLVDEQSTLGGQYYRARQDSSDEGAPRYLRRMAPSVDLRLGTSVFDASAVGVLSTWDPEQGATELRYDFFVLATGAYDRPVAIPGWTLPGVMTAGGVLALAKGHHVVPGARVVVAGAGPFLLDVADVLQSHECDVTVIEATRRRDALGGLPALLRAPDLLIQAVGYLGRQTLRRWAIRYGEIITAIHGNERVEAVSVARVDGDWRPIQGSERLLPTDAVCLGFGFVPHLDLAQLAKCSVDYDAATAGFAVATDDFMRTSVPHVYAAGESVGIAGIRVARLRGRIAGLTAAYDAGLVPALRFAEQHRAIRAGLARYLRVATWISSTYGPRPALWGLAGDDTVVCRCEDVLLGEIERALEVTEATPVAVKTITRAGMGPCQGRFCSPFLVEWLRARHGFGVLAGSRPWSVQPPVRPVPVGDWVAGLDPVGDRAEPRQPGFAPHRPDENLTTVY
jgi:NADPH-dependent 2,4-dienoyl-CoA reductase/sulfur reductase-like enzyme